MKKFPNMPVQLNIWIRPELQRKQFEVIKKVKPGILVLSSDGGRNDAEWDLIYKNREMFEKEVDWECDIYKLYANHNHGMYANAKYTFDFIFSKFDRVLGFEDDQIPSVSYFRFCDELLEKYKDDLRICGIVGGNIYENTPNVEDSYFFSRRGVLGTCAYWKRTYDLWNKSNLNFILNKKYNILFKHKLGKKNLYKANRFETYAKNDGIAEGHICWAEDYFVYQIFAQNQLMIVPKYNMVTFEGVGNNNEHSDDLNCLPNELKRLYFINSYDIEFPLKHPDVIIENNIYEHEYNKYNNNFCRIIVKFKRFVLCLFHKGLKYTFKKTSNYIKRKNNKLFET